MIHHYQRHHHSISKALNLEKMITLIKLKLKAMLKLFYPFLSILAIFSIGNACAQNNVGIGTVNPSAPLHVSTNQPEVTRIENTTPLAANINTELYLKTGSYFTGVIKTIGTSAQDARLGFFTFATIIPNGSLERLSILDNGNVGINQTNPAAKLDVNGTVKIVDGSQAANRVLTSDATGLASWKALPASSMFGATQATGTSIPNATDTEIGFSSETYDPGNSFSSGKYTIPTTGVYHFDTDVPGSGVLLTTGTSFRLELRVNNIAVRSATVVNSSGTAYNGLSISCDLSLTAGNIVNVFFREFNSPGNPVTIGGSSDDKNPHFTGHKVF